jgi:protein O-mannosyl-transferase
MSTDRLRPVLVVGLLAVAVAATHGLGLNAPFHYDDKPEILLNASMQGLGHWRELWDYNAFRFLLLSTFSLQYNTTGTVTWPFHLVNLVVHLANAGLVTAVASRMLAPVGAPGPGGSPRDVAEAAARWPTLAAGLLFAVHPLMVEGVTYVSGRSSSLATTFYLVALLVFDGILRQEAEAADGGERFRAVSRRASLLLTLGVAVALVGGLTWALLSRFELATGGRAGYLGLAAALLAGMAAGPVVRRLLAVPLPAGPPAGPLMARWGVIALLYVSGAMVKEIVITLPAALWLWELCFRHRGQLRPALRSLTGIHLPLLIGPLAMLILRYVRFGAVLSPDMERPVGVNLWTEAEVVWRYVVLFLWPVGQSIFHDHPASAGPFTWPTVAAIGGWIVVLGAAVALLRRWPVLSFVVLFSAVVLSPTSSVLPLKETMAEHRAYLPAVAWCAVPGWLVLRLGAGTPRRTAGAAIGVVVVLLGLATASYTRTWNDEEDLWLGAVEHNPDAAEAWYMLGDIARSERRLDEAAERYRRCLEVDPTYAEAANNLGLVYAEQGDLRTAYRHFRNAQRIASEQGICSTAALNNLARVLTRRQDYLGAVTHFESALDCDPTSFVAHVGLGQLFEGPLENRDRALDHYRTAVRLYPNHPLAGDLMRAIEELSW